MNITGTQLITDAMRQIGALASGEAPSTDESNDGLIVLNKLIDSLSAEVAPLVQLSKTTQVLSGAGPYTMARPLKIKAAECVASSVSSPVEICSAEQWSEIVDTTRSGQFATKMYCDYAYPTANFFVWPAATGTLTIHHYAPLTTFSTLSTSIDMPNGYARMLRLNLALDLCSQFGRPIPDGLPQLAQQSKGVIIAANAQALGTPAAPDKPLPQGTPGLKAA